LRNLHKKDVIIIITLEMKTKRYENSFLHYYQICTS